MAWPRAAARRFTRGGEEELPYPQVVGAAEHGAVETEEAVRDHNAIRDSIAGVETYAVGNDLWWAAYALARRVNAEHLGERSARSSRRSGGASNAAVVNSSVTGGRRATPSTRNPVA